MNDSPADLPANIPATVIWLGYGGLLPFVTLAATSLIAPDYAVAARAAMLGYGAVILSFVGALHWSFAMTLPELTMAKRDESFIWSIVPALVAWISLVATAIYAWNSSLHALGVASGLLIAGFAAHFVQDRRLAAVARVPTWYLPLRLRLTWVASLCVALAALPTLRTVL
jgi:Protein of unknown function (DUF3429)